MASPTDLQLTWPTVETPLCSLCSRKSALSVSLWSKGAMRRAIPSRRSPSIGCATTAEATMAMPKLTSPLRRASTFASIFLCHPIKMRSRRCLAVLLLFPAIACCCQSRLGRRSTCCCRGGRTAWQNQRRRLRIDTFAGCRIHGLSCNEKPPSRRD